MISGVLHALLVGLMWGLISVGLLIVPECPAVSQPMGCYLALGLIVLPIAWLGRARSCQPVWKDWVAVLTLAMMGNLIYYVCPASVTQRIDAPASTMIIDILPVVIPVSADLLYNQRDGKLSWWRLSSVLVLIGIGLLCVNISGLDQELPDFSGWHYGSGIALVLVSVVCWAWYALCNARWLRENPDKHPIMWATVQALVTLPASLLGYTAACLWLSGQASDFALPFGPCSGALIGLMVAIAVSCPWVGALRWNIASQKLPAVILGLLIVFETLAGLLYTFILCEESPPLLAVSGIMLPTVGVVIVVRAKPQKPSVVVVSQS